MSKYTLLTATVAVFLLSCEKRRVSDPLEFESENTELTNGFQKGTKPVHAYLFAAYQITEYNGASYSNYASAFFADPGKNLYVNVNRDVFSQDMNFTNENNSNVSMESVTFNNTTLIQNSIGFSFFRYRLPYFMTASAPVAARWSTSGKKSFAPINETTRGFPTIDISQTSTITASNGYTFDAGQYATNYDSLTLRLNYGIYSLKRTITPQNPVIVFTQADLGFIIQPVTWTLSVTAYNYSSRVVKGKYYIFENAARREKGVYMKP